MSGSGLFAVEEACVVNSAKIPGDRRFRMVDLIDDIHAGIRDDHACIDGFPDLPIRLFAAPEAPDIFCQFRIDDACLSVLIAASEWGCRQWYIRNIPASHRFASDSNSSCHGCTSLPLLISYHHED